MIRPVVVVCHSLGTTGRLFTGSRDGALRRGNVHRETAWTKTVVAVGLPAGFHFHDLRWQGQRSCG